MNSAQGSFASPGGENPLDNTAVHPESYGIVNQMAKDLSCTVPQLIADKALRNRIEVEKYITPTVGLPTLKDILQELDKPGRDPRDTIQVFDSTGMFAPSMTSAKAWCFPVS